MHNDKTLFQTFTLVFNPQGIYIKSTYDGLHVITGTTENVSVLQISQESVGCQLEVRPTVFSLLQTKPRGFTLEMKWFRSTNRQW